MKKEQLQKISTFDGAFEVLKPLIEQVSYVEVEPSKSLQELKMDSLDCLEVLNNVEKIYCEEASETVFGEEWQKLEKVSDLVEKMVAFAKAKLERSERIEMASEKVRRSIETLLRRFSKRGVFAETKLKDLGVLPQRLKDWAENYFGFKFSQEDREAKVKTFHEFYIMVIKYYDQMERI